MKQMIILLSTIILGIAISVMVMSFKEPAGRITENTKQKMEEQLQF